MPSLPEKIRFAKPLQDVRLVAAPHNVLLEQRIRARMQASYEKGREEGEKALGVQLIQQRSDMMALQNGVLDSLRQCVARVTHEHESALIELALEVAQKLVAGLPISQEMVEGAIKEALAQVQDTNDFVIVLNPEDLDLLQRVNSPMTLAAAGGDRMRFEASEVVGRGGCVVKTHVGTVDAQRETKFELLKKSLHN